MKTDFSINKDLLIDYSLGQLDPELTKAVEKALEHDEGLRKELYAYQGALETFAQQYARHVPNKVGSALKQKLNFGPGVDSQDHTGSNGSRQESPRMSVQKSEGINWVRLQNAAAWVFLLASLGLNWFFYSQNREYRTALFQLREERAQLAQVTSKTGMSLMEIESMILAISIPGVKMVPLITPGGQEELARVFWNPGSEELFITGIRLPIHPPDKQYQLWAIVDGKPQDAGLIDPQIHGNQESLWLSMKKFGSAEAFAITLENFGGSQQPSLEQLKAIGQVSS